MLDLPLGRGTRMPEAMALVLKLTESGTREFRRRCSSVWQYEELDSACLIFSNGRQQAAGRTGTRHLPNSSVNCENLKLPS